MSGLFLTFEGADGAGKTTQVRLLEDWLRKCGLAVFCTREPGGTAVSESVRSVLLNPELQGMDPWSEVFLYAAARRQLVEEIIRPALTAGQIVLCDRYIHSTVAYQGYGRRLALERIHAINEWATERLLPDLTFVFDVETELGLARTRSRQGAYPDRIESEAVDFHRRVRQGYLLLAQSDPERIKVIDASQPVEAIQEKIRQILRLKAWPDGERIPCN